MYIYFHITCINHYKKVCDKMIRKIKESGLYDEVKKIYITLIGEYDPEDWKDPKFQIIYEGKLGEYETETINRIDTNEPVLYIHSKGVTKPGIKTIDDWTDLMIYYLIDEWKMCLEGLKEYDTVGVNLHYQPIPNYTGKNVVHYSGNMWWANGIHLKNIGKLKMNSYLDSEMYVCQKGKHLCLWDSCVNHYHEFYPCDQYIGKINTYSITN